MADEELLLELLDSWQLACARGQAPTAAELCGDRLDLVAPLHEQIVVLQRFEQLRGSMPPAREPELREPSTVDYSTDVSGNTRPQSKPTVTAPASAPAVGAVVAGFKLLGVLGEGGFGTVFRAQDTELRRKVALKILHAQALARPGAQERFLAEARALAVIQHDHVVPIFQVGRVEGQLFLAMPLLGGETLAARLDREGALPADEVRRIGREVAAGLGAIHARGLVHRDLKPGNIWLEAGSGRVKVLDLGLAENPLATRDTVAGTPSYMSPEQVESQELDFRSDLFSLGTVLYECACGRRPFAGGSMAETLRSVREVQPPPLTRLNPGVPPEVGTLIERLLQKDPANRPASAAEVEKLLRNNDRPGPASDQRRTGLARFRINPWMALASCALLFVAGYLLWPSRQAGDEQRAVRNLPLPAAQEPLRVVSLDVRHFATLNQHDVEPRGILGRDSFGAVLGDEFDVRAQLSRPAHAFLVVFRPDGKDEVLYPQDANEPPPKSEAPLYPSRRREDRYVMEEGAGLWLVALIASDEPLPSYRDWRAAHPSSPWGPVAGKADRVWYDDGQLLETLDRGRAPVRGDRAGKNAADKVPVVRVVDWLRAESRGTVSAVAFTVQAKR